MEASKIIGGVLLVLMTGLAGLQSIEVLRLRSENARLKAHFQHPEEQSPIPHDPSAPSSTATHPDDVIQLELLQLRGEVAALRRKLAAASTLGSETAGAKNRLLRNAGTSEKESSGKPGKGWVDPQSLPVTVAQTLQGQLGDLPLQGAHVAHTDDGSFYSIDTRLSDGRGLEMTVDEDGVIRSRQLETSLDTFEPAVQQTLAGIMGDLPVQRVTQVFKEGQTRYVVRAKTPEQGLQILLGPDGTVLRTEWERPRIPPEGQAPPPPIPPIPSP